MLQYSTFSLYLRAAIFYDNSHEDVLEKLRYFQKWKCIFILYFNLNFNLKELNSAKGKLMGNAKCKIGYFFHLNILYVFSNPIILCNCQDIHHAFTDLNLLLDKTHILIYIKIFLLVCSVFIIQ